MRVPKAVLGAFHAVADGTEPKSLEVALEAALEAWRTEQLAYLDGLTFDSHDKVDYQNGWNDCREDVERAYIVIGEPE